MFPLTHTPRNQVFTALFNLLQTTTPPIGTTWNHKSQYLQLWTDVPAEQQPAMFLQRGPQSAEQKHVFGATRWQFRCWVWIYYRVDQLQGSSTTYPDQLTDQFLDNLEQVMATDPLVGKLTLGDLVHHVWIDGQIFSEPGINDGQAFIIVPLSILL